MNDRIKELRKHLKLSQEHFAKTIGITRAAVAKLETGASSPSGSTIKAICNLYHVSEEWLVNGTGEMFLNLHRDEEIADFVSSIIKSDVNKEFKKRFISMLSKLSEDEWKRLSEATELLISLKDKF